MDGAPGDERAEAGGTAPPEGGTDPDERRTSLIAALAALLLGLATVATAWGAYQANRWGGVMATDFNEATRLSTDAGKLYQEGDAAYSLDTTVYVDWAVAVSEGNEVAAAYLEESLFSDALTTALAEWEAQGDAAPDSPFDLEAYVIPQWAAGDALEAESQATFEHAKEANQNGDDYVLVTVVFASVLFFAGMASTVSATRIKVVFLVIGAVLFVGAAATMATYPVY